MPMNLLTRVCLLVALVAPGAALSDEPAPPARSTDTLGAVVQPCARLNVAAAERNGAQGTLQMQGAREETLATLRQSDECAQCRDCDA